MLDALFSIFEKILAIRRFAVRAEATMSALPLRTCRSSGAALSFSNLYALLAIAAVGAFLAEWSFLAQRRVIMAALAFALEAPFATAFVINFWKASEKPFRRDSKIRGTKTEWFVIFSLRYTACIFVIDFMVQTSLIIGGGTRLLLMYQDAWTF